LTFKIDKKKPAFPAIPAHVCYAIASHLPIDSKILNLSPPLESKSLNARFKLKRDRNQLAVRVALPAMNLPPERLYRSIPCRLSHANGKFRLK